MMEIKKITDKERKDLAKFTRRRTVTLWGEESRIKPELVSTVFGDGKKLLFFETVNQRPWYYLIMFDSAYEETNESMEKLFPDIYTDDIEKAVEEEFGFYEPEESTPEWPQPDFSCGSSWCVNWWNNPFTKNDPQFIGPQISPQVNNVYNKLKSACSDSCVCDAGEGCTKPKCESEARQIAQAYVNMWNEMAENETPYYRSQVPEGTGPSTAGQTHGDSHCGWMCYHWRTHTYNALAPLQKDFNCFKTLRSGTSRTTQIDEPIAVIHSLVTVSVGSQNEPEGDCSHRLDPWHGFVPLQLELDIS